MLRERINGSKVVQLKPNIAWDSFLSECPFLGITKTIFFNDFVKSKGRYVNNVSFYLCAYLEFFILDTLDSLAPSLVPNVLNEICQRWNWSNKFLVYDINPPNNQFCFPQFFARFFLSLSSWKRKQTFYWSKTGFFSVFL